MRIECNGFVLRQTRTSQFSHWEGAPRMTEGIADLEALAMEHFRNAVLAARRPGDNGKGEIWSVPVPVRGFYGAVASLPLAADLAATYAPRRIEEDFYIQVTTRERKAPAKHVDLIVYSREALGGDATSDADAEIVSINARVTEQPEPMHPFTMARNELRMIGGTATSYTSEEYARAIVFWAQHALVMAGEHHDGYDYGM